MAVLSAVVRYDPSFSDEEVRQLAADLTRTLEGSDIVVSLEEASSRAGAVDQAAQITLELGQVAVGALIGAAMKSLWEALINAMKRRRGHAGASPAPPPVLDLPGPIRILLPNIDLGEAETELLMTAVIDGHTTGWLTPGVWRWDSHNTCLVKVNFDGTPPEVSASSSP